MHSVLRRNLLLVALVFIMSTHAVAQILSNFTTNDEGWTAPYASAGAINYNATGGNPTGNVSALAFNIPLGATSYYVYFYFHAPVKFTGNRSTYLKRYTSSGLTTKHYGYFGTYGRSYYW